MAEQISYSGTAGFDYDGFDNWKLSDYPEGYVCPNPGTSVNCYTGGWRSMRPIWDSEACTNCMLLGLLPRFIHRSQRWRNDRHRPVPLQGLRRLRERMQVRCAHAHL